MRLLPARKTARILAGLTLALLLIVAGLEAFTRVPVAAPVPALDIPADARVLVLVIHGSADADNPQLAAIVSGLQERYRDTPGAVVRYVRWAPWSDERLRAAATAVSIGGRLGAQLAGLKSLQELHLIAHSSGAFMPDAICAGYRAASPTPARIIMVLLDAFQIRGFVDWTYGARHHGGCADFALAVLNTDDPAPATNRPLVNAFNLDVTADPARKAFFRNGHYWPLDFYRDHLLAREPAFGSLRQQDFPRGEVRTVDGLTVNGVLGPAAR